MTDLTNMRTRYDVRGLSDQQLCEYIGSMAAGCGPRVYAEAELARRLDKPAAQRAWIVIGIAVVSLAVSMLSALLRGRPAPQPDVRAAGGDGLVGK